jgi:hypothetical protein
MPDPRLMVQVLRKVNKPEEIFCQPYIIIFVQHGFSASTTTSLLEPFFNHYLMRGAWLPAVVSGFLRKPCTSFKDLTFISRHQRTMIKQQSARKVMIEARWEQTTIDARLMDKKIKYVLKSTLSCQRQRIAMKAMGPVLAQIKLRGC